MQNKNVQIAVVFVLLIVALVADMFMLAPLLTWIWVMGMEFSIFGFVPAAALSLIAMVAPWCAAAIVALRFEMGNEARRRATRMEPSVIRR